MDWSYLCLRGNAYGLSLSANIDYDVYLERARTLTFNLVLPEIIKTNMNFRYTIENSPESAVNGYDLNYRRTNTAYANISTTIIPRFVTSLNLVQKTIDGAFSHCTAHLSTCPMLIRLVVGV